MAEVKWLPEAADDLDKLDNSIRKRVFKTIRKLQADPLVYGTPLGNHKGKELSNLYKIEPADGFRIIYAVFKKELVVVTVVGKRADERVYKTATERISAVRALVGQELEIISQLTEDIQK